jgi:hypothetical protein
VYPLSAILFTLSGYRTILTSFTPTNQKLINIIYGPVTCSPIGWMSSSFLLPVMAGVALHRCNRMAESDTLSAFLSLQEQSANCWYDKIHSHTKRHHIKS